MSIDFKSTKGIFQQIADNLAICFTLSYLFP
jgi:DNA-binding transcriptional regulator YhcF (GntR family)